MLFICWTTARFLLHFRLLPVLLAITGLIHLVAGLRLARQKFRHEGTFPISENPITEGQSRQSHVNPPKKTMFQNWVSHGADSSEENTSKRSKYNNNSKNAELFSLAVNVILLAGFSSVIIANYLILHSANDLPVILMGILIPHFFMTIFAPLVFCKMNPQILPFVFRELA